MLAHRGRALTGSHFRHAVTEMSRRIAAILLMQSAFDENCRRCAASFAPLPAAKE
jgi:hypothetical protein